MEHENLTPFIWEDDFVHLPRPSKGIGDRCGSHMLGKDELTFQSAFTCCLQMYQLESECGPP